MGKKLQFDPETYTNNIRAIFARADQAEYLKGREWFPYAGAIARAIGSETGHDTDSVAAIISALSPRHEWSRNVDAARRFCEAAARGDAERPTCQTYNANSDKAWRIACGANWADVLRGIKVESFLANIAHADYSRVTVDVWAIRVATLGAEDEVRTDAQYRAVETAYQMVAAEVGLMPAELQAICWLVAQRMCEGLRGASNTNEARRLRLAA